MRPKFFLWIGIGVFLLFASWRTALTPYVLPEMRSFPKMPVPTDNPMMKEGVMLGRFLFYDPILSSDSSISCASCHKQEYAFSDGSVTFSKGLNGNKTNRNAIALFNLGWSPFFFYDGKASTLEDQVSHPVRSVTEMNMNWPDIIRRLNRSMFYKSKFTSAYPGDLDSTVVKKCIAQFLRSLVSYRSRFDQYGAHQGDLTDDEFQGFRLSIDQTRGDCIHCHPTDGNALMTTFRFSNNGLDPVMDPEKYPDKGRGGITGNIGDNGKFRIPSLRNIALTAPYMHDGRFKTLEEVVEFYSSGVHNCANIDPKMGYAYQKGVKLSAVEKKQIVAFLHTLTDSAFITSEEFGDPFKKISGN